jgi:hypothetical protein
MEAEMFKPVFMARQHNLGTSLNCCDIHSISKNLHQVILARYHHIIKPLYKCFISSIPMLFPIDSFQYVEH